MWLILNKSDSQSSKFIVAFDYPEYQLTSHSLIFFCRDHYQIADKIRDFLGLDNVKDPLQWDATNEESSSSNDEDTADDFEQIDKSELLDETIDNTQSLPKDKEKEDKDQ